MHIKSLSIYIYMAIYTILAINTDSVFMNALPVFINLLSIYIYSLSIHIFINSMSLIEMKSLYRFA
jgi:hypothetical protein